MFAKVNQKRLFAKIGRTYEPSGSERQCLEISPTRASLLHCFNCFRSFHGTNIRVRRQDLGAFIVLFGHTVC